MADKNQQVYPLAPANGNARSDEESATSQSKELKRKKRIKLAAYIAAFAVFQTVVILVFALVVMRARTPKLRFGEIQVLDLVTNQSSPSFSLSLETQLKVKNANFGPYKFENATLSFSYQGFKVGELVIPKSKAGFRSTKKMDSTVNLNSSAVPEGSSLSGDLGGGLLTLNTYAKLNGKVELMFIMKKKKSTQMNCTIIVNLSTRAIQEVKC